MFRYKIKITVSQLTMSTLEHRRSQDFWLGGANYKSHAMTLSDIFKEELFEGLRYRKVEGQKPKSGFGI